MNRARPLWPGTEIATLVARHVVPRDELLERLADQLLAIGFGLREDLRVFDVVERLDDHPVVVLLVRPAAQRFQRALANIDAPNGVTLRHGRRTSIPYSACQHCLDADSTSSSVPSSRSRRDRPIARQPDRAATCRSPAPRPNDQRHKSLRTVGPQPVRSAATALQISFYS